MDPAYLSSTPPPDPSSTPPPNLPIHRNASELALARPACTAFRCIAPRRGRGMLLDVRLRVSFASPALFQDVHDSGQGQAPLVQGHQQVEQEVRGLLGQALVALPL